MKEVLAVDHRRLLICKALYVCTSRPTTKLQLRFSALYKWFMIGILYDPIENICCRSRMKVLSLK